MTSFSVEMRRYMSKLKPKQSASRQPSSAATGADKTVGKGLELRLIGLPLDIKPSDIAQAFREDSGPDDESDNDSLPIINSVAQSVHTGCSVATLYIPQTPKWIKIQRDDGISTHLEISGQQVSVDDHFHGLTPLHWPSSWDDWDIDIIAVTGLAGNPIWSWKPAGASEMWLRDWLGQDFLKEGHRARVFTYGYPSKIIKSDNGATLNDYGNQFLAALKETRKAQKNQCKPLILIGHSYGGLVIKQALKIAHDYLSAENKHIFVSCECLVLLGVPNTGLDNRTFSKMAENQSNRPLIDQLGNDSRYLEQLDDDFGHVTRDYPINIIAIFETNNSRQPGIEDGAWKRNAGQNILLVSKGSAVSRGLGQRVQSWPSCTSHSNLAKFEMRYDVIYSRLLNELVTVSKQAIAKGKRDQQILLNVPMGLCKHFVGRDDTMKRIYNGLKISSEGARSGQVFILHGGGGVGKSLIARQHVHSHMHSYSKIAWVNAESPGALFESFRAIADLMGLSQGFNDPVPSVLSKLSREDGRVLLVYDNLDDMGMMDLIQAQHQVRWENLRVIITTRDRGYLVLADQVHVHLVGPLSPVDGKSLFLAVASTESPTSDENLMELGKLVGWHPLALEHVASHLKVFGSSLDYFLQRLREPSSMVKPLGKVYDVFERSLEKVESQEPLAAEWFKMCSLLGTKIDREVFDLAFQFWRKEQGGGFGGPAQELSWLFECLPKSLKFSPPYDELSILPRLSLIKDPNGCWELDPLVARWARDRKKTNRNGKKYLATAVCLIHACAEMLRQTETDNARRDTDEAYYVQLRIIHHSRVCIDYCNREFDGKFTGIVPAECIVTLATWGIHNGEYNKAISMLQSVIGCPRTSPSIMIDTQRTLAWALRRSRRCSEAYYYQEAAIESLKRGNGQAAVDEGEIIRATGELASIFRDDGRLVEAINIQGRVVEDAKRIFGLASPETWHEMSCLGAIHEQDGQRERTLEFDKEILRLCQSYGGQEQYVLRRKKHLAISYFELKRFDESIELGKQVLVDVEKSRGPYHVETATVLHRLAQAYHKLDELEEADKLVSKALEVRRELLGDEHEKTKKSANLASEIQDELEIMRRNSESTQSSGEGREGEQPEPIFASCKRRVDSGIADMD